MSDIVSKTEAFLKTRETYLKNKLSSTSLYSQKFGFDFGFKFTHEKHNGFKQCEYIEVQSIEEVIKIIEYLEVYNILESKDKIYKEFSHFTVKKGQKFLLKLCANYLNCFP